MMSVEIAPLTMKPPHLDGLSQRLVESHYENNYGGAVQRLNAIEAHLSSVDWRLLSSMEINGIKREQLLAANSVRLHEIYFDSLGGGGDDPACPELNLALERDFGSIGRWRDEFVAMGRALAGGAGWVVLAWSDRFERLTNQWAADHGDFLAGASPLLALDMYEHAYHMDFGANASEYVEAFMRNIAWDRVAARYRCARDGRSKIPAPSCHTVTAAELHTSLGDVSGSAPIVIDVRLEEDRARDALPGSPWRDIRKLDEWCEDLPRDRKIVVYCMYGFWVSKDTTTSLRERGYDAYSLKGGISAWRGMGYSTEQI